MLDALSNYLHDVFVVQFDAWVVLGFVAQALFSARFLVQWIASERAGRSVVPTAFWVFSIGGGVLLSRLFALPQGPGLHRRARARLVHLYAQPLFRAARAGSGRRLMHRGEAALQIGGEIADIFQSDVKADGRAARLPLGRGAERRAIERDREALEAAP